MIACGVDRRAEARAAGQHAADDAGLGGQRDEGRDLLLVGDRGDALRHADAEVDDAVRRQLEGGAARDDLALVERHLGHAGRRARGSAPESAGSYMHAVVHAVHLGRLGDDDAVDQDAGHLARPWA